MRIPYEMNRKNFALTYVLSIPTLMAVGWLSGKVVSSDYMQYVALAVAAIYFVILVGCVLLRLTNIGKSKWWALGFFVPLLNLYVFPMVWAYPPNVKEKGLDRKAYAIFALIFFLVLIATTIKTILPQ